MSGIWPDKSGVTSRVWSLIEQKKKKKSVVYSNLFDYSAKKYLNSGLGK